MKIIPIESNKSFKFHGRRVQSEPERPLNQEPSGSNDELGELLTVLTGLGLTAWLPTLVWCVVAQDSAPAYLVGSSEIIGAIIGVWLYQSGPPNRASCVPATTVARAEPVVSARIAA